MSYSLIVYFINYLFLISYYSLGYIVYLNSFSLIYSTSTLVLELLPLGLISIILAGELLLRLTLKLLMVGLLFRPLLLLEHSLLNVPPYSLSFPIHSTLSIPTNTRLMSISSSRITGKGLFLSSVSPTPSSPFLLSPQTHNSPS